MLEPSFLQEKGYSTEFDITELQSEVTMNEYSTPPRVRCAGRFLKSEGEMRGEVFEKRW